MATKHFFLRQGFWVIVSVSIFGVASCVTAFGKETAARDGAALLLSRLDLARPGLEKVKAASGNPDEAAKELLEYYRARTSVKHPVDRSRKKSSLGKCASARNLKTANEALKHILTGHGAYPAHPYGDDIDWTARPVADIEWVAQLSRVAFWIDMALAYWHTGDEKYAEEWVCQLTDWVKKNPRDIKIRDNGNPWTGINTGCRAYRLTSLFQYFLDSPAFTPEFLVTFLNTCYEHSDRLMEKYTAKSNWALMEAEGMAFIAILFPEFKDAEKWKTEAVRRFNIEIDNQVNPDGHQRELAIGYHIGCISWFGKTLDMARLNGIEDAFPESYRTKIEKMCEIPMKLGLPDGAYTQFGDSWKGRPKASWGNLKQWAARYDRPDFLYVATGGKEGKMPEGTAFAFPDSGLYSMRSGWDEKAVCLVLKCGHDGRSHCQPDNGTFELYAGGRHLMPDSGCYIYNAERENRLWFRQTKVHQTLTLDGKNTKYAPKLLCWRPGDDLDVLVVENAGYPDLTHRRAVFFVDKKYFILVDEAYGKAKGDVDLHFQFLPGKAVFDQDARSARTGFEDGWNVSVQNVLPGNVKLEEEEGQVSYRYKQKEPRPAFRYRVPKTDETGIRYVTVVVPYAGKLPEIKAELSGDPVIGGDRLELEISVDGKSRRIGYGF